MHSTNSYILTQYTSVRVHPPNLYRVCSQYFDILCPLIIQNNFWACVHVKTHATFCLLCWIERWQFAICLSIIRWIIVCVVMLFVFIGNSLVYVISMIWWLNWFWGNRNWMTSIEWILLWKLFSHPISHSYRIKYDNVIIPWTFNPFNNWLEEFLYLQVGVVYWVKFLWNVWWHDSNDNAAHFSVLGLFLFLFLFVMSTMRDSFRNTIESFNDSYENRIKKIYTFCCVCFFFFYILPTEIDIGLYVSPIVNYQYKLEWTLITIHYHYTQTETKSNNHTPTILENLKYYCNECHNYHLWNWTILAT